MDEQQTTNPDPPKRRGKPAWRAIFLEELGKWGVIDHAIRVAGVNPSTAYEARRRDAGFRAEWDEAEGRIIAVMEVVARQRALTGVRVPVIFQGKIVDTIQEVDSGLLKWLLAKKKPEVYGDKVGNEPAPQDINLNVQGTLDLRALSVEQLQNLRDLLAAATVPAAPATRAAANGRYTARREEPA